jgi:hypothetical protein
MHVRRGELFGKGCLSNFKSTVTIPGQDHQSTIKRLGVQAFPKNPPVPISKGVFENVLELGKKR